MANNNEKDEAEQCAKDDGKGVGHGVVDIWVPTGGHSWIVLILAENPNLPILVEEQADTCG